MEVPIVVNASVIGGLALALLVFGFIEFADDIVAKLSSFDDSNTDLLIDDLE